MLGRGRRSMLKTKLIPCWFVGQRDASSAYHSIHDLKSMSMRRFTRLTNGFWKGFTQLHWAGASCNFDSLKRSKMSSGDLFMHGTVNLFYDKIIRLRILRSVALSHCQP